MTNDRFREAIEIEFEGEDIETIKELETLMRHAGFNRKFDKEIDAWRKRNPTQTQLDFAWEYLKEIGVIKRG